MPRGYKLSGNEASSGLGMRLGVVSNEGSCNWGMRLGVGVVEE